MPGSGVDSETLLAQLREQPTDHALRARVAQALEVAGQPDRAVEVLREGLINLTAHGGEPLPCLCKRCLEPARSTASAGGETFHRAFAVADGRVLYYWLPAEMLDERARVRASVEHAMKRRLAASARAKRKRRR